MVSRLPVDGDQAMVHSAVERSDGSVLAIATACPTSPDCSASDVPAVTSVWTSHDGGASWTEVERLEGVPDDPNTIMLTDGAVTFAAIAGTDADGAVRTALVQISPDGDGVVVGERRWPGAESAAVFGVERSSDTIITVVAVHDGDTHVPHVMFADLVDARQDAIDLRSVAGLRAVSGLVDIDGSAFAVGVAQTDDDYQPALVKITP